MLNIDEIVEKLETEYPNDAMLLKPMSELDRSAYLAQLELIVYIKEIVDGKHDRRTRTTK